LVDLRKAIMSEGELRGKRLTVETYCQQVAASARMAFGVVRTLGAEPDAGGAA
jgi:hypothetical protein